MNHVMSFSCLDLTAILASVNIGLALGLVVLDRQMVYHYTKITFLVVVAVLTAVLMVLCLVNYAMADPPPDADPAFAPWFRALTRPSVGTSCCGEADCRRVDYRIVEPMQQGDSEFQVFLGDTWMIIPDAAVLRGHDNPTGMGVVCVSHVPPLFIYCFVPAAQT